MLIMNLVVNLIVNRIVNLIANLIVHVMMDGCTHWVMTPPAVPLQCQSSFHLLQMMFTGLGLWLSAAWHSSANAFTAVSRWRALCSPSFRNPSFTSTCDSNTQDYDNDAVVVHMGCFEVPNVPVDDPSKQQASSGSDSDTNKNQDKLEMVVPGRRLNQSAV
jgi:hypothetical protein